MKLNLRKPDARFYIYANAAISFVLVLGMACFLRDMTSLRLGPEKQGAPSGKQAEKTRVERSLQDYEMILQKNPFGFPGGELKACSPASLPEAGTSISRSDIALIGTVAGSAQKGYAIFSDRAQNQELFGIGDSVFGLGRLKRVDRDRAWLESHGKDIEFSVVEIAATGDLRRQSREGVIHSRLGQPIGSDLDVLDQKTVSAIAENPNQIMTEAQLLPNLVDGKPHGFKLTEVKPGGVCERLCLQEEDVLLRVNGGEVSSPESAFRAFSALKGMDRVQLDIIRSGTEMTMAYQIQ